MTVPMPIANSPHARVASSQYASCIRITKKQCDGRWDKPILLQIPSSEKNSTVDSARLNTGILGRGVLSSGVAVMKVVFCNVPSKCTCPQWNIVAVL